MLAYIRQFLSFHKSERNGIVFLISLNLIVFISYQIFNLYFLQPKEIKVSAESIKYLESVENALVIKSENTNYKKFTQHKFKKNKFEDTKNEAKASSLNASKFFPFDPNKIDKNQWLNLGLSEKQANVIQNYVSSGGKFYKKEDLKKIYSISPSKYSELEPYINIDISSLKEEKTSYKKESFAKEAAEISESKKEAVEPSFTNINLVKANAYELQKIDGIDEDLARKIVNTKFALGGFLDKKQLLLVDGMNDSLYNKIENYIEIPSPIVFRKIKLNEAEYKDFVKHPLISESVANSLVMIRVQHGNYEKTEDIMKSAIIDEDLFNKLAPYLSVD